ncbi:MAG: LysR family transcriptional regulator [Myxococcales bacterium]|nr:LysR family transcriptional regulator [Myxococcales bacterium]
MDWSHLEAFVRIASAGSLSQAARELGVSQPTLSRHAQALEESLGVSLFVRHARGVSLTERGHELLASARTIDDEVQALMRHARGARQTPAGTVRLSVNEPIANFVLAPAIAALRREHPRITLELVVDNSAANLSRREADLAVRMFRPDQLDLVAKRVGEVELGLYVSRDYIAHHGLPTIELAALPGLGGHTLIGFDRDPSFPRMLRAIGMQHSQFALRCDSITTQIELCLAGAGIAGLHVPTAARHGDNLVRVLREIPLEPLEIWLVMHQDVRGDIAVRAVMEAIEPALAAHAAQGHSMLHNPADSKAP